MTKVTVHEVRYVLIDVLEGYSGSQEDIRRRPDEKLLNTNVCEDYGLDSADFVKMLNSLYDLYGVNIPKEVIAKSVFYKEPTVENFIKLINGSIELKDPLKANKL